MKRTGRKWRPDPGVLAALESPGEERPTEPVGDCPVSGKRQYDDEAEAQRAADHRMKRAGERIKVYYCLDCFHWHLTSH